MSQPSTFSTVHPTSDDSLAPAAISIPTRLLTRLLSAGALVAVVVVAGRAFGDVEAPPPSSFVIEVEAPTLQLVEQRTAAHLRHLRRL